MIPISHVKTMVQLSREAGPQIHQKLMDLLKTNPTLGNDTHLKQRWGSISMVEVSIKSVYFTMYNYRPSDDDAPVDGMVMASANMILPDGDPLMDDLRTALINVFAGHANLTNTVLFAKTIGIEKFNVLTDEAVIYLE